MTENIIKISSCAPAHFALAASVHLCSFVSTDTGRRDGARDEAARTCARPRAPTRPLRDAGSRPPAGRRRNPRVNQRRRLCTTRRLLEPPRAILPHSVRLRVRLPARNRPLRAHLPPFSPRTPRPPVVVRVRAPMQLAVRDRGRGIVLARLVSRECRPRAACAGCGSAEGGGGYAAIEGWTEVSGGVRGGAARGRAGRARGVASRGEGGGAAGWEEGC